MPRFRINFPSLHIDFNVSSIHINIINHLQVHLYTHVPMPSSTIMNPPSPSLKLATFFSVSLLSLAPLHAVIIASESFNTPGALAGSVGGVGWAGAWTQSTDDVNTNSTIVSGANLTAAGQMGGAGAAEVGAVTGTGATTQEIAARPFAAALTGTVYVGVLLKTTSGAWGAASNNTLSFFLSNGTTNTGALNFGIRGSTADLGMFMGRSGTAAPLLANTIAGSTVSPNTDYYLVAKISQTGAGVAADWDKIDIWLNPVGSTELAAQASLTTAADGGLTTLTHFLARSSVLDRASGTEDIIRWDELKIGSAWSDVVAVPEPSISLLAGLALLGLTRRRRAA